MKLLADILTSLRVILSAIMIRVGITQPQDQAIPTVVWLTIVAWTTDWLDGPIARRSGVTSRSWLARHDFEVDLLLGISQGVVLAHWGAWLPIVLTLIFFGGWSGWFLLQNRAALSKLAHGVWPNHNDLVPGSVPLQLFVGILYGGLIFVVWTHQPNQAVPLAAWLVLGTALHPRRAWSRVRDFFRAARSLLEGKPRSADP